MPLQTVEIDLAAELPVGEPPDTPHWAENYCFHGYDRERRVGVWFHLGRVPGRPGLVREQLFVFLPDGSLRIHRGFGDRIVSGAAAGSLLRAHCEVAGKQWQLTMDGVAVATDTTELLQGPLTDRNFERLAVDVTFSGTTPVLMYPRTEGESWGSSHYEQAGTLSGTIVAGEQTYELDGGFAFRDHSRGPRDLSHHTGSSWMQGLLPDGSLFTVYEIWQERDGAEYHALEEASLVTPDGIRRLQLVTPPPRPDGRLAGITDTFPVEFRDGARLYSLQAKVLATLPFSLSPRFDWVYGTVPGGIVGAEQPLELTLDGRTLDGYYESTIRLLP